ncbi:MAG TPA: ribose 5-phosphate isomerase A [Acidimicrobiales bacterium]|nr:ribose 5-phosphate isomerase A [Acidimicrobiales bacterium]
MTRAGGAVGGTRDGGPGGENIESGEGVESAELEKRAAAEAAAALVEPGMTVGLGTGSTVAYLLPALARRGIDLTCVATSRATESQASELGLTVVPFAGIDRLDIAIDGADQVAPDGWLVKGGGGAHVREKVVASAAGRFVVIVSSDKLVERVAAPIPVEILAFGVAATLRCLAGAEMREGAPASPDGGLIADWHGEVGDPAPVAAWLESVPGVVGHGLFPPALVHDVLVARGREVEHRRLVG